MCSIVSNSIWYSLLDINTDPAAWPFMTLHTNTVSLPTRVLTSVCSLFVFRFAALFCSGKHIDVDEIHSQIIFHFLIRVVSGQKISIVLWLTPVASRSVGPAPAGLLLQTTLVDVYPLPLRLSEASFCRNALCLLSLFIPPGGTVVLCYCRLTDSLVNPVTWTGH